MQLQPIDPRTVVRGTGAGFVWMATWDGHEDWSGSEDLYIDIFAAFPLALAQYVYDEYAWEVGADHPRDAPDDVFTWQLRRAEWILVRNGLETGVRLHRIRVVKVDM